MKTKVLLLGADTAQRDHITLVLSAFTVLPCRTAAQALTVGHESEIGVALLVNQGANRQAEDDLSGLRQQYPGIEVFQLSASVDPKLLQSALEKGFSGVLPLAEQSLQLPQMVAQAMARVKLKEENTRLKTLIPLCTLGEQFLHATSIEEVLERFLDAVTEQTGATHVSVMLYDQKRNCLKIAAARGLDLALIDGLEIRPGDRIAGWVFQQGTAVILNREDQQLSHLAPLLKRPEISSAISYPLQIRSRIIGVLNISQTKNEPPFSGADKELLSVVCSQAVMAIENVRSMQTLTETTRMRTLFEQYVSSEIAELLLSQDSNLLQLGEIKTVTVLFADIRNFTRLVEHLDLAVLRPFLNSFFQLFTEVVYQYQGTVDKFMGDAVLAIFGSPLPLVNANLAAAKAALAVKHGFEELRANWSRQCEDFRSVDLGIAITCGDVFLGNVGSSKRLDYTVLGNQVNRAQRLASASTNCSIYITEPVCQAIEVEMKIEPLGEMELKGVAQATQVFCLSGAKA